MGKIKSVTLQRAQALRRHDTEVEARLWNALRAARLGGWRWKRQVPFGPYILDFLCRDARLVIELDGSQHADQLAYDARRTAYLQRAGLRVIRFWNSQVLEDRSDVCDTILHACGGERPSAAPPPPLPPRSGEGEEAEVSSVDRRASARSAPRVAPPLPRRSREGEGRERAGS